jgi:hypothetical protein
MDINQLRTTLHGWNVTPPDIRRASLYLTQIQATRTFLFTTLATDPVIGGVYNRFANALQYPDLLNDFCKIIDDFLAPAVSADLQHPPARYTTYDTYFDINIFQANGGNYNTNVQNFFGRYPATSRAVQNLTTNFQNNIRTACQRIQTNWTDLDKTFTPDNGQITQLLKIESTGSDFHKGGQQVLILTFHLFIAIADNMGDIYPLEDTLKIVYKPSDLEVDCLLAGNTVAVNAIHPNFQQASLFEIINELILQEKPNNSHLQTLPTYKILPYNWGSSLNYGANNNLPIRNSYGYIQFLEHRHAPGFNILNYYPFGQSDFKIFPNQNAPQIARQFYQQIGELVAIASTFSIIDMHIENVIASRYQPHLIDMEICLTESITNVSTTEFFGGIGGITGGLLPLGVEYKWRVKGNSGHLYIDKDYETPYKQNRLWTMQPNQIVNPVATVPANAIFDGFFDGLFVIRQGVNAPTGNRFTPWFTRLNNAVVRYLPYGTGVFRGAMGDIYHSENRVNDANYYQTRILNMVTTGYENYQQNPTPQPDFVAVQATYTATDYQNCDIPAFYHRIGTTELMDSFGNPVLIPTTITIDDVNHFPNTMQVRVQGPLGRNTFFAQPPTQTNVRNAQVNILNNAELFNTRYQTLRTTLLNRLGLQVVPPNVNQMIH